ncbi:MAG: UDP-N-acetylmuramate--L-alanine ligase [Clostridiaceae bacterium]|nr:UDP-N-acetylmuramate--L-alanine ligase [Clostridiaceae bacterium]
MSGLAEILIKNNYKVSGSDIKASCLTRKLENMGMRFFAGHSEENIKGADLIVHTAAVKSSNPEMKAAKEHNIPIIERPILLGEIMKKYPHSIAISGTHGKTTTTSMVSLILLNAGLDPTILVGGELEEINGNVRVGNSTYFVTEACEYVDSFLKFYPFVATILNIEEDHLDYFKNLEHIISSFRKFAQLVPDNGYLIICGDDAKVLKAVEGISCNIITFGIKNGNWDWSAKNIFFNEWGLPHFDIVYKNSVLSTIQLNIPGIHNIYNALAAAATASCLGVDIKTISKAISNFRGTHRRFETKGNINGIRIIDDYAHHPSEIKATLAAASRLPHNKLWCIFQPHTYTRTLALMDEFASSFGDADKVIITDIYAAREVDNGTVHATDLVHKIKAKGFDAQYISKFEEIAEYVMKHAKAGDMVLTMGAGDIYLVGKMIFDKIRNAQSIA